MGKRLKVISTKLSPYYRDGEGYETGVQTLINILKKERKREKEEGKPSHPILMLLPEEEPVYSDPQGRKTPLLELGTHKKKPALFSDEDFMEALQKLGKAAKEHNAHIIFGGPEKINFKKRVAPKFEDLENKPMSSLFLLNKGGLAVIRRQVAHDIKISPASIKTINIEGFNILPLNCRDFLDEDFQQSLIEYRKKSLKPEMRVKKPVHLVTVSASSDTGELRAGFTIKHPRPYKEGLERLREVELAHKDSILAISNRLGGKGGGIRFYKGSGHDIDHEEHSIGRDHRYGVHIIER